MKLILACLATALLVLAGAAALDYHPPNALADGPQADPIEDILREFRAECMARGHLLTVKNQGGVIVHSCDLLNVGVGPAVRVRR